ncbi:MAG: nitroreductase family protein [Propionibacteriaceae bacterium]|nr:nitroreductase family protein [Propionibacteriaceae bacterium]
MDILEAMRQRRSTRAFDGRPLSAEHHAALAAFIASTSPPFGVSARIELIQADLGSERVRLGSYGSVRGARDFMGLVHRDGPLAREGSAYWFEQVVLYCTSLGLGTVWLAGFTRSSFSRHVSLAPGESLNIACPVGYPGGRKPLPERLHLMSSDKLHTTKKPFAELFLGPDFSGLTPDAAGDLELPLQLTRLAPSAINLQPYRVVVTPEACHFHIVPNQHAHTDLGIALCHFEQTCLHQGIAGGYSVLSDIPSPPKTEYVISFLRAA